MRRDAGMVDMFSMLCIGILFSQKYFFFVRVCVMNLIAEERNSFGKKREKWSWPQGIIFVSTTRRHLPSKGIVRRKLTHC